MKVPPSTIARLRKQDKARPEGYDLCMRYVDDYIDITQRYDNTWTLGVHLSHCVKRFATRTAAIDYLENADLKIGFA